MPHSRNDVLLGRLRSLVDYNPETGTFTWRPRPIEDFVAVGTRSADHMCKWWDARFAGKEAFTTITRGYLLGRIDTMQFMAHRAAWAYMTGAWPDLHIDHINGVGTDNRFCNLRLATVSQNQHNRVGHGPSGLKGVSFDTKRGKWGAMISVNSKRKRIGWFSTAEAAHEAYVREAHLLHGSFANTGHKEARA
jgi:hypothetical protein